MDWQDYPELSAKLRVEALQRSMDHHSRSNANDIEIVETAHLFQEFLTGNLEFVVQLPTKD